MKYALFTSIHTALFKYVQCNFNLVSCAKTYLVILSFCNNDLGSFNSPKLHRSLEVRGEGDGEIGSSTGQQPVKQEREGEGEEGVGDGLSDREDEEEGNVVEDLVKEWSNRLGPKYQVKVCLFI